MNFDIPEANTHPDVAKDQHFVPRTYMRQWSYNSANSIWVIDKSKVNKGLQSKNVENINYQTGFYDIKAGDIFMPDEALSEIYGFLLYLTIEYNGNPIKTLREIHDSFFEYEDWEIWDKDGIKATRKEKNRIYSVITQSRYTFIEEQWCYQFEDQFVNLISNIERKLRCKVVMTPNRISAQEYKELMEYLLVFDFRNEQGNSYVNEIIERMPMDIFDEIDIPQKERVHSFNKTAGNELRHALRISSFYNYLKNRKGVIKEMADRYLQNLGMAIYLTKEEFPFITSELASFIRSRPNGLYEHIFIASPTMLITTFRDNTPGHVVVSYIKPSEVWKYNKCIAKKSKMIITKKEDLNYKRLLAL